MTKSNGYPIRDGFKFDATGLSNPVHLWVEGADGKRKRSDSQATDENGVLLWAVGVTELKTTEYGRDVEVASEVTVSHPEKPLIKRHAPIVFKDLYLDASSKVNNGRAETIRKFTASSFVQAGSNNSQTTTTGKE